MYDDILSRFASSKRLVNGYSDDVKYFVTTELGERCLLRIASAERAHLKRAEFAAMQRCLGLGFAMPQPLELGELDGGGAYILQTWLDGEDAENALPSLGEAEQYRYGVAAGKILRKIHSVPAPTDLEPWAERFGRKTDFKIAKYTECPLKFEGDAAVLRYLSENSGLLNNRPQTLQHGDFHCGNMILTPSGEIGIIDFDRPDFGDPWEEFNRIVWCADASREFATGRVDGYFDGDASEEFWRLMAFYICSNLLSSMYWALEHDEEQERIMLEQAADVMQWYENMTRIVPTWYDAELIQKYR